MRDKYTGPWCLRVGECAHPRDGRCDHEGVCVDCGQQVTSGQGLGGLSAADGTAIAAFDYEGRVAAGEPNG